MKRRVLTVILAAVLLAGCSMPDMSFEEARSPFFKERDKSEKTEKTETAKPGSTDSLTDEAKTQTQSVPADDKTDSDESAAADREEKEKDSVKAFAVQQMTGRDRRYDTITGNVSAEMIYTWLRPAENCREEFPKLGSYLDEYEKDLKKRMTDELVQLAQSADGSASEENDPVCMLDCRMLPVRADTDVFSAVGIVREKQENDSRLRFESVNVDSHTGQEISLEDVIKTEGFDRILKESYDKQYSEEAGIDPDSITSSSDDGETPWTLSENGIDFYFSDKEGTAPVIVQVLREDYPDAFTGSYEETPKSYMQPLAEGVSYPFGRESDGSERSLKVTRNDGIISVEVGENSAERRISSKEIIPVLVRTANEGYYIYVNCPNEYDELQLAVFDISDGKPVYLDCLTNVGFPDSYDDKTAGIVCSGDPDDFELESGIRLLGTYGGRCQYAAGENGVPEAKDEWYYPEDDVRLTVRSAFHADAVDEKTGRVTKEDVTIREDSELTVYRTDGKSIVDLMTEDKELFRADVDTTAGWPQKIDGINVEKLFEGLQFAG